MNVKTTWILALTALWAPAYAQTPGWELLAQDRGREAAERAREERDRSEQRGGDLYRRGTNAIEKRDYERAIGYFDQVIENKGSRADGAYYWKAYAQNKLGRRDQAQATLAELQKAYPQSRWLNDAKALAVEVRQAAGQPVSPDAEGDEDLKLLALNSIMNSDPSRAIPLVEKVLRDPKATPRVKERAMFVLAQSHDPSARNTLISLAKGAGNPDVQLKAVEFLGIYGRENTQALVDVYKSTSDPAVKRAALRGMMIARSADQLIDAAKSEKDPDLRREAIRLVGAMRTDNTKNALIAMYGSESDPSIKREIINALFIQQDAKPLIELARKEQDPALKRELVSRLAHMKSKEATDYMMEILNK